MSLLEPVLAEPATPDDFARQAAERVTPYAEYASAKLLGGLEATRPVEAFELGSLPSRYAADEYGLMPPGPPPADLMSKEQFDSSPYKRPGLEYEDGETEARAAARAAVHDRQAYRDSLVERSDTGWLGQLGGAVLGLGAAGFDPTNYIPLLGPASKAAMLARFGRIGGSLLMHGSEAALNTGLFEPLAVETARVQGRGYGWEDAGADILFNTLGGAVIGTAVSEGARALGFGHGATPGRIAPVPDRNPVSPEIPGEFRAPETGIGGLTAPPEAGAGVVPRRPGQSPVRVDDMMRRADAASLALDQHAHGEPVDVGRVLANDPALRAPEPRYPLPTPEELARRKEIVDALVRDGIVTREELALPEPAKPPVYQSETRVGDEVARQLAAAGVPASEARPQAALWQSFFDTMGRRAGIDPGALFDRYRVGVARENGAPIHEDGTLYQFAGEKAQGAPLDALERAKKMDAEGADPREIWKKEGWFKGPDGKWRWEISDKEARIGQKAREDIAEKGTTGKSRLPAVLWHKPLYEAYPHLREATAEIKQGSYTDGGGSYNSLAKHISVDAAGGDAARRSMMLHETQHAVQDKEGFAEGGSPDFGWPKDGQFELAKKAYEYAKEKNKEISDDDLMAELLGTPKASKSTKTPEDNTTKPWADLSEREKLKWLQRGREYGYRRLAGEAEARAVQARADMTPEERRATFPLDSYDVPAEQLIVRGAQTLLQGGEGAVRGSISFAHDGQTIIRLFQQADASTFLHESGHLFARVMRDLAERNDAPEDIARDWRTLRDWLGVKEGEGLGVEHEEKLARGFEAYLRDGEAPTPALRGVFETIKGWLRNVYKTLAELGVTPSPEVREVFDRMLGGEEDAGRRGPMSLATATPEPPHPSVAEAAPRVGKGTPELETFAKDAGLEGYDQPLPGHEPKPEPGSAEAEKSRGKSAEIPPTPREKAAATAALPPELGEIEAMRREGTLTPADEATLAAGEAEAQKAEGYADAWQTLVACVARNA